MIDNNTQWALWCVGWACVTAAAYLQAGVPAGLATLGAGVIRASGVVPDSSLASLLALFKPGVKV